MIDAAGQGTCNNPPTIGGIKVNGTLINTTIGPLNIMVSDVSSFENTCESCETNYTPAMPQGEIFAGLMSFDQDPITITSTAGDTDLYQGAYEGYELRK